MIPLGAWVAVEPLIRRRSAQGMLLPWTRQADEAFPAFVLAVGDDVGLRDDGSRDEVPFERGDVVLVEAMSGHPFMAGEERPVRRSDGMIIHGRTRPVDARADLFGGSESEVVALVAWLPEPLQLCQHDEQAARRIRRRDLLHARSKDRRRTIDDDVATKGDLEELRTHNVWLGAYENYRDGRRRSKLQKPALDQATGEGILGVYPSIDAVLVAGADPEHLTRLLTRIGVVDSALNDLVERETAPAPAG